MNTALTAAVPAEFDCYINSPECEDPWIDGWRFEPSDKKCGSNLNSHLISVDSIDNANCRFT